MNFVSFYCDFKLSFQTAYVPELLVDVPQIDCQLFLLPLWTARELTETETLELLEEVEVKTDKAKIFNYSKKIL